MLFNTMKMKVADDLLRKIRVDDNSDLNSEASDADEGILSRSSLIKKTWYCTYFFVLFSQIIKLSCHTESVARSLLLRIVHYH